MAEIQIGLVGSGHLSGNTQPTPKELRDTLHWLYLETLQFAGDGWWHKIENVQLQNAVANAAHMLGYHGVCEHGLCAYRNAGFN